MFISVSIARRLFKQGLVAHACNPQLKFLFEFLRIAIPLPLTQEAEIRRIMIQSQPKQIV
jgi:hypothetical protein